MKFGARKRCCKSVSGQTLRVVDEGAASDKKKSNILVVVVVLRALRKFKSFNLYTFIVTLLYVCKESIILNRCKHILDDDGVFASDVGRVHKTSTRYSRVWIFRRTLPSITTRYVKTNYPVFDDTG